MTRAPQNPQQSLFAPPSTGKLWPRLRRRKRLGLLVFASGLCVTAALCWLTPPLYQAEMTLKAVAPPHQSLQEASAMLAATLRAPALIEDAIDKLSLAADPELNPRIPLPQGDFKSLSLPLGAPSTERLKGGETPIMQDVTRAFSARLRIAPGPEGLVRVSYRSADAEKAALVVNTLGMLQQDRLRQEQIQSRAAAAAGLQQDMQDVQQKMRATQQAVHRLRAQMSLPPQGISLDKQEEQELVQDIAQQRLELTKTQTRLAYALNKGASELPALARSGILNSPALQERLKEEAAQTAALQELQTRYGEKHPRLRQAARQADAARAALKQEAEAALKDLGTSAALQEKELTALEVRLENLQKQDAARQEAQALLQEQESLLHALRQSYGALAQKTQPAADAPQAGFQVLSAAGIPSRPVWPPFPGLPVFGFVISLAGGLAAMLLRSSAQEGLRTAEQVESALHYPCYALIPAVSAPPASTHALADIVLHEPAAPLAEALRNLLVALELRPSVKKPGVVALTSSFPDEGKTTLAVWLGRMAARSGKKVVLLDADLRRPSVHKALGKGNDLSLAEVLSGRSSLAEATQKDTATGMDFIAARAVAGTAFELLASARLQDVTAALRQNYDLVIIDLPACLAVADARLLTRAADVMLYAVAWNRTPLKFIRAGLKLFIDIHYKSVAFVLTNVDVKRHVRYGYGDSAHVSDS